jgi:hypothetical protein
LLLGGFELQITIYKLQIVFYLLALQAPDDIKPTPAYPQKDPAGRRAVDLPRDRCA